MKQIVISFIVLTLVFGCNQPERKSKIFNDFDFSYNDVFSTCFSIKFTQGDTVYIRQHFSPSFSDLPPADTSYVSVLQSKDRERLDSFIKATNFNKYDSVYYEGYQDGIEFQFFIVNDSTRRRIYVHSMTAPKELYLFAKYIVETKKRLKHTPVDTVINYGSLKNFLPPTVSEPIIFTPPKVE
jgi:hypothetical protein